MYAMPTIKLDGREISLSNLDKIYFPEDNITKGMLVGYYKKIAPHLLPYIKDRPLTMQRYPEGIHGESFFQKNVSDYFPEWIKTIYIPKEDGGGTNYVLAQDTATLVYLANQGCITSHMWLSTIQKLNHPNVIVFDLDPSGQHVDFPYIIQVAKALKLIIEHLGLTAWVMTTGSRGLHIRIPIKPEYTFTEVRAFARDIANIIIAHDPEHITLETRKEKRGEKLLLDILRNGFGATAVVPYAVRARPGAPVATPLTWQELDQIPASDYFTMATIFNRLEKNGDPMHNMHRYARSIKPALEKLRKNSLP